MDPSTAQSTLETDQNDCQTPRRPLDKAHCKVEPNDVDRTERELLPTTTKAWDENNDLTNDMTWVSAAQQINVCKARSSPLLPITVIPACSVTQHRSHVCSAKDQNWTVGARMPWFHCGTGFCVLTFRENRENTQYCAILSMGGTL